MHRPLLLLEVIVLMTGVGCQQPKSGKKGRTASVASARPPALRPRAASRFHAKNGQFRQEHPRLPDTGEWRCAERGKVVWCAGGQAAAGVVRGPADRGYRCGPRWGTPGERVCIDQHPDYPGDGYECKMEEELGVARICRLAGATSTRPLPTSAVPACWLDRDCPTQHCDRGACGCSGDRDCQRGVCRAGACVEERP